MILALLLVLLKGLNPEILLGNFGLGMGVLAFLEGCSEIYIIDKITR